MGAAGRQLWFHAGVGDGLMAACSFLHTTPHSWGHLAGFPPITEPKGTGDVTGQPGEPEARHRGSQPQRGAWEWMAVGTRATTACPGDGLQDVRGWQDNNGAPSHERP